MTDRGAIHLTLVALLFGGTLMLGLAVDITRIGTTWREASHLATTAAESGAGWIDEAAARNGILRIDPPRARAAARGVALGDGRLVNVTITPDRVCVRVRIRVQPTLLAIVGAAPQTIAASACAEPRQG